MNIIRTPNSKEQIMDVFPEEKNKLNSFENSKEKELIDLYGFDVTKKHTSIMKSITSINSNYNLHQNLMNYCLNENYNCIPLAFALEDENYKDFDKKDFNQENLVVTQDNKKNDLHDLGTYEEILNKTKFSHNKERKSITSFKKSRKESIIKRLKIKKCKKSIKTNILINPNYFMRYNKKVEVKKKFDFNLLKKQHQKEIWKMIDQINELEKKIKKSNEEEKSIDEILQMKELKDTNFVLTQHNKNLTEEIRLLKDDMDTLERFKNEYISKLKKDLEKEEAISANAKFSIGQLCFEKDCELLKYKNYSKKLKITIKSLESNNNILTENLNTLNSKYMTNKSIIKF